MIDATLAVPLALAAWLVFHSVSPGPEINAVFAGLVTVYMIKAFDKYMAYCEYLEQHKDEQRQK